MARIRAKDTGPELTVRRLTHKLGYRYRLHRRELPGSPDLVFLSRRKVIFVHGCFWHRHGNKNCTLARLPKSRLAFWKAKLEGNKLRDRRNRAKLSAAGWRSLVIWECQLRDLDAVTRKIAKFLGRKR